MEHYVYIHLNPITEEIFYVGIGKGNRAWNKKADRNRFWDNYVNKYGFKIELVAENLTRKQAEILEMDLIAHLGRKQLDEGGVLVNRSVGGDGGCGGYTHTEEWKFLQSKRQLGIPKKPHTIETKEKLSKILKGRNSHVTWNKPVIQYDKEGNFIKEWISIKDAEKATGAKSIWEVVSGYKNNKVKTSGGYIWEYKK
jgi:hypothetical protein